MGIYTELPTALKGYMTPTYPGHIPVFGPLTRNRITLRIQPQLTFLDELCSLVTPPYYTCDGPYSQLKHVTYSVA